MQVQKTVFISYRRTNIYMARAVQSFLKLHGFDVFLDFESIDSGDFGQIILNQIAARAHFLIILTPSALERCLDPNDWLRKEIEHAVDLKRNIVPLLFEGFDFRMAVPYLSPKMQLLPNYNGLTVPPDYFDEALERLINRYLNKPLELILHPVSKNEEKVVEAKLKAVENTPPPDPLLVKAEEFYERGVQQHALGNYKEAVEEFSRAILLNDNSAQAYAKRGSANFNLGNNKQARLDWTEAVKRGANDTRIHFIHSLYANYIERNFQVALEEANQDVVINPYAPDAYMNRGNVKRRLGYYEDAISDYDRAIKINPLYAAAYFNRADTKDALLDYSGAIADYDTAIEINSQDASSYLNRGTIKEGLQDYHGAIADYDQAIALNPQYALAYNNRGEIFDELGNYQKARADFETALRLNPEDQLAQKNLNLLHEKLKKK